MRSMDMNRTAAPYTYHNKQWIRKRSYESLEGSEDDRENLPFQDVERPFSEEETKHGSKRTKGRLKNTFYQSNCLMQGLESPGGTLWQRHGESSLDSSVNPSLYSLLFAASCSPIANDRDQVHPEAPYLLTRQESQPRTDLYTQPQEYLDPNASWNYAQVYGADPQDVAMQPQQHLPAESVAQQHDAVTANVRVNGGYRYAAPHTTYPYRYSEQYPYYGVMSAQAMPALNPNSHNDPQQQYFTRSSDYQHNTTQALTNDLSHFAIDQPPEEQQGRNGHPPALLYTHNDDDVLSGYQIFLRKQIEFFEADKADVNTATPGRKKPVALGQVGIRCKHCANVPIPHRTAAAVYFPTKLKGLYQAAQNIGTTHLKNSCPNLPDPLKAVAKTFQVDGKRATAGHGGKVYWSDAARRMGVVEADDGLRFFIPN